MHVKCIPDVDRSTFSISPRDSGVGEGSWAGLCFNPTQWSMVLYLLIYLFLKIFTFLSLDIITLSYFYMNFTNQ